MMRKNTAVNYLCLLLGVLSVGVDQLIKWIVTVFMQPFDSVVFLPGILRITYVQNTGAAFGMLDGNTILLAIFTGIIIGVIVFFMLSGKIKKLSYLIPLSMLAGGGVGNLIDRIFRGFVVDYIDVSFWPFDGFAIFNFADCLVVVGTILLLVFLLKDELCNRRKDRPKNDER